VNVWYKCIDVWYRCVDVWCGCVVKFLFNLSMYVGVAKVDCRDKILGIL